MRSCNENLQWITKFVVDSTIYTLVGERKKKLWITNFRRMLHHFRDIVFTNGNEHNVTACKHCVYATMETPAVHIIINRSRTRVEFLSSCEWSIVNSPYIPIRKIIELGFFQERKSDQNSKFVARLYLQFKCNAKDIISVCAYSTGTQAKSKRP